APAPGRVAPQMEMTQTLVERLAEAARDTGRIGLDTEFMPEGRYRPLLCLVQLVVGDDVAILDPLAGPLEPGPLADVLADPAIEEAPAERDPEGVWRRRPRATGLDSRERAVARALAAWRERTAAREDRPVGSVMRDPSVVELAKRQPAGRRELAQIRGITPDVVRRRGDDVIAAIQVGTSAP